MRPPPKPMKGGSVEATINAIIDYITASRITSIVGGRVVEKPGGTSIVVADQAQRSKRAIKTGPFCRVFKSEGNWYLTGGQVSCGEGNETIADIDFGSIATPPTDGTHFWLAISFTATVEDDVLLPGGDVTAATVASGTTIPDNTIPTASVPAGTIHVSLGSWTGEVFVPAGCGNIQIAHCPGSLTYSRA